MILIGNNATDIAVGADAIGAAGALLTPNVHLVKADIAFDRETTLAQLDAAEADYDGYGVEALTWGPATIADSGEIEYQGVTGEFRPTGSVVQNVIYGIYLTDVANTTLLFCARFDDPPLPMGSTLDNIVVTPRWRPQTGGIVSVVS